MAKHKNIDQTRLQKKELWLERTRRWSGLDVERVQQLLTIKRSQSLRYNPLKPSATTDDLFQSPIVWCENGYELTAVDHLSEGGYVERGEVYVQNAASWLPVLALEPEPGETILDVCAAPGGKASHIQAITQNKSTLTCNDNSKPRLMKLKANMKRLGAEASYTLCDATKLSRQFTPFQFDKILLDAPCSGEGLMTLNDLRLFDSWSVAHIRRLSDLQKKILHESWQLLAPGGTLVYSTCTMAPEENEAVIDYFLRKHPAARLEEVKIPLAGQVPSLTSWNDKPFSHDLSACLRLLPGPLIEAFFVAKLVKRV